MLGASANGVGTAATRQTDDNSDHALRADVARSTFNIDGSVTSTGTAIRIGILSDSFNALGKAATDEADGDLPSAANVHIVSDYTGGGGTDEGRAMAELVHRIAPGAQIYFYTGENSQASFATGITTLQADGCQIIIDDLSYYEEPFYQADGTVQKAIDAVTAKGVTYFTSITNNGNNYYEGSWSNIANFDLPGVGSKNVHNVGNGSPYETFTISRYGDVTIDLQWAAPFKSLGGAGDSFTIGMAIYDLTSGSPVLVKTFAPDNTAVGNDPTSINDFYNSSSKDTKFAIAFYGYSGAVPAGAFKAIFIDSDEATFTGIGSGTGSGATFGHNAAADANPTAAVYYGDTPAEGGKLANEGFSSQGGTVLYYDGSGNELDTPITIANAAFSATDGDSTSVSSLSPFSGTSAAAPQAGAVAALVLAEDGRLTNTQVSYLLGSTAVAFGTAVYSGDGLIDADAAVTAAHLAVTTPIWTAQGSSNTWSTAANWSDNVVPTAATAVTLGNGIGSLTGSYTVVDAMLASAASTLLIDGTGAALYALSAVALPVLRVSPAVTLTVGSIAIGRGELDISGRVVDQGAFAAGADAPAGGRAALIENGGFFEIGSTQTAGIEFTDKTGTLQLDTTALLSALSGTITGFNGLDQIDLTGLAFDVGDKAVQTASSLEIDDRAGNRLAVLALHQSPAVQLARDATGGTLVSVACFARATRILTDRGEVAVEDLAIGDTVVTASGGHRPVKWIGWRSYAGRFLAANPNVHPVRFRTGSLGNGLPHRDLLVSPEHAMLLDGVLVPARCLVNGSTVRRERGLQRVDYFHVELDSHDALLAEGAASESFLDDDSRGMFHNAAGFGALYPDAERPGGFCAPRVEQGHALEAIRRRLEVVAATLQRIGRRTA